MIEYCDPKDRFELEQLYLDIYKPELNITMFSTGAERKKANRPLTDDNIREIFSMYADGEIANTIKAKFSIKGGSSLGLILDRHIYWDVDVDESISEAVKNRREGNKLHVYDRKLSAEDALSIIKEYTKGIRIVDLAKRYKVGRMTITTILDRKLYKEVKVPKLAEQLLLKQRINN